MAYITVVQHDTGLVSSREKIVKIMQEMPNADASAGRLQVMTSWLQVLVLSAGGYGHVPIPLFKQPEVDWPCCARSFAQHPRSKLSHESYRLKPDGSGVDLETDRLATPSIKRPKTSVVTSNNRPRCDPLRSCKLPVLATKALLERHGQPQFAHILHGCGA